MKYTSTTPHRIFYIVTILLISFLNQNTFAQLNPSQLPLDGEKIPQFVDPLPHYAGKRVNAKSGGGLIIQSVASQQLMLSTGTELETGTVGPANPEVGLTNLWTYRISKDGGVSFTQPLVPAVTIEAMRGNPLSVSYQNLLSGQTYASLNLIVDQTIHWVDPFMAMGGMDPYTGAVPTVTHLHGGEVAPESDGNPYAWFTPNNAQKGYAFNPNPYYYPNQQEAATLWYHDHSLGVTRLNVYAGLVGFYWLRDPNENQLKLPGWKGDGKVQEVDKKTGKPASRPAYLPEIELVIQDRTFDTKGEIFYTNEPPNPTVHPVWTPEFFGNTITVNGKTWPYLSVAPRKYRFRLLNASNARFYELALSNNEAKIKQIGTDGGFLDAPVRIKDKLLLAPSERADIIIDFSELKGKSIILTNTANAPYPGGDPVSDLTTGRVMEFVVNGRLIGEDESEVPSQLKNNVKLTNFAGLPAASVSVSKVRQLTLNEVESDEGPLEVLVNNTKWSGLSLGTTVRPDFTQVKTGMGNDPLMDYAYYSETFEEGKTEVWRIVNTTEDAHPIHIHLMQFQLMSRQPFLEDAYEAVYHAAFPGGEFIGGYGPPKSYDFYATAPNIPLGGPIYGGNPDITPFLSGSLRPANANEKGWKDTFIMYPGEVTTVIARMAPTDRAVGLDPSKPENKMWYPFDPSTGLGYVWHCHILDHEDNEMMRPYSVSLNPARSGKDNEDSDKKNSGSKIAGANIPTEFDLKQNYPNPFNPSTNIQFALPVDSQVELKVFNSLGQEVSTLINSQLQAGYHKVMLDASALSSGVYLYRLQAGDYVKTQKMILAK